jgi:hypothetical protein
MLGWRIHFDMAEAVISLHPKSSLAVTLQSRGFESSHH